MIKPCAECNDKIDDGSDMFLCMKTKEFFHRDCIMTSHALKAHIDCNDIGKFRDRLVTVRLTLPQTRDNTE